MAALAYTNADILIDGYRVQAYFNELNIEHSAEMLDKSVFSVTTRINQGGLFVSRIAGGGLAAFGSGSIEALLFGEVGSTDEVMVSTFPAGITEGEASGYAMQAYVSEFNIGGPVGSLLTFSATFEHGGID